MLFLILVWLGGVLVLGGVVVWFAMCATILLCLFGTLIIDGEMH